MGDQMEVFPGISMNPDVRFGKPCIAGTRMDVATVVGLIASGETVETVASIGSVAEVHPDILRHFDDVRVDRTGGADVVEVPPGNRFHDSSGNAMRRGHVAPNSSVGLRTSPLSSRWR